eukprot:CAMPEP_0198650458 /NCGR_PEP_ID=MMETSP1467-20131203/4990_1 /TAXON_ID=1462469 /ORGANISM="unid. sp., Strain CCMP2135" /LENGTH=94 /DNA_ID=CAMNT_0044386309 /DNA_START=84 /DNA_END=365 /DNA_ORIENTATION=-
MQEEEEKGKRGSVSGETREHIYLEHARHEDEGRWKKGSRRQTRRRRTVAKEEEEDRAILAELGFHGAGLVEENGVDVFAVAVGVDDFVEGDFVD